jgi:hypothetical protein
MVCHLLPAENIHEVLMEDFLSSSYGSWGDERWTAQQIGNKQKGARRVLGPLRPSLMTDGLKW